MDGIDLIDGNCGLCYNRPSSSSNSALTPTRDFVSSCTEYISPDILQTLNCMGVTNGLSGFCEVCHGSINQLVLLVDQLSRIQDNISQLSTKINQDVVTQRTIHQNKKVRASKSFRTTASQNRNQEFNSIAPLMTTTETIQSTDSVADKVSTSGSEKLNNTQDKAATSINFDDQLDWSHSPAPSDKSVETGDGDGKTINSSEILTHMKNAESGFKCENCSRTFSRLTILKSHDCTKETYDCETCGFSFSGPSVLKLHVSRTHSGEKPYKCDICGTTFGFKHHLARHIRIHTGEKPFECPECDKKFGDQSELAKHKIKHKNVRFPCEICGTTYAEMATLRIHLKTHVDSSDLKCDICHKTFCRALALKIHKERVHSKDKSKSHCCEYCGKSFRSTSGLQHHMLRHTSEQNVECDICSKLFSCAQYLRAHKAQSHPKLETVVCDVCGKNYKNQQHLRQHYMRCHMDYTFECQKCGKKYKNSQQLAQHVSIIHKKEKPHKCEFCQESFKFRSGLKRHKLKAHLAVIDKNKFFTCPVCSEPFEYSSQLLSHQLQLHHVTSEEFVKCSTCSQKFADLGMYEWHMCKKPLLTQYVRCHICEIEKDDENDTLTFANYCEFFDHLKYAHDDLEQSERYKCKHCGLIMPVLKIKTHPCDKRDNPVSESKLIRSFEPEEKKGKGTKISEMSMERRRSTRKAKTVQKPTGKRYCESDSDEDDVYSSGDKGEEKTGYLAEEGVEDLVIKCEIESYCDSDEMSSTDVKVKTEAEDDYFE